MIVDKRFSPANYEAPEFLQETYVGESGQKIVSKFDTPFGGIVYRRNADGSIDSSLKTGRLDGLLTYIGTQSDGKVIFVDSAAAGVRVVRIGPGTIMETNLVEMQSTYYIGSEADGAFQVELLRAGDSSKPISVWAKTQDGTAQAGLDYEPLDHEITFAPYEVVKKVPIRILQDSLVEGDENFTLKISEPAVGTMVLESIVSLTLIDDDRIELQLYQEWDGQWVVYADNQTGRNIELQSSDDGARTWEEAAEPQVYVRMPISFEGRHRFYRAVLRDSSQTCPR